MLEKEKEKNQNVLEINVYNTIINEKVSQKNNS